jgi:undecaprenyl-diphosphatase
VNPLLVVAHSDDWVAGRIRRWSSPRWFQAWLVAATRLGDGWAWLAVLVTMPARHDHREAHVLAEALIAAVAVNAAQVALKRTFRRTRPATAASRRAVVAPDQFSFPSGHTMNAFAVAVLVSVRMPAASPLALAIASGVGTSRVALGLHYPSDVVAGAVLGSALAGAAVLVLG